MHSDNAAAALWPESFDSACALASGFLHMNSRALSLNTPHRQSHRAEKRRAHTGDIINPAPPFHPNGFFAPPQCMSLFCEQQFCNYRNWTLFFDFNEFFFNICLLLSTSRCILGVTQYSHEMM